MTNWSKNKLEVWNRRRKSSAMEDVYHKLEPYMHRCEHCVHIDSNGIACPDCALRRAVVFSEVYGVVPDTAPYSVPRSQSARPYGPSRGIPMPGYPTNDRYGPQSQRRR